MTRFPVSPVLLVPLFLIVALLAALLLTGRVPLSYNVRNLLVRWRMTLLTAMAFALVVGLLVVMQAFINGMLKLTEESGYPENVVVLSDGANDESFSTLNFTDSTDIDNEPGVKKGANGRPLCSREVFIVASMPLPPKEGTTTARVTKGKVNKVALKEKRLLVTDEKNEDLTFQLAENGKVTANDLDGKLENLRPEDLVWIAYEERGKERIALEVHGSSRRRFVQIRGVEDPLIAAEVHRLQLLPGGSWFGEAGVEELPAATDGKEGDTAMQVVLGEGSAQAIGPVLKKERLEVGDVFELGPKKCKVVGIIKSAGTIFGTEVWAKRSYVGELYGKPATISSLTIATQSADAASNLAASLKDYPKDKLNALTETDYYSQQRAFLFILLGAIIFLTFFMAMGGIFGVMNTMFAAISQRTKDIGVLRILGYARWQILASFLLESFLIALAGGLIGCAVGALFNGRTATGIVGGFGSFGKSVQVSLLVDASTIALGLLLTLIMGLFGGLLPSLSAMRLRPLESLR